MIPVSDTSSYRFFHPLSSEKTSSVYGLHVRLRFLEPSVTRCYLSLSPPFDIIIITMFFHSRYRVEAGMIFRREEEMNFIYPMNRAMVLHNCLLRLMTKIESSVEILPSVICSENIFIRENSELREFGIIQRQTRISVNIVSLLFFIMPRALGPFNRKRRKSRNVSRNCVLSCGISIPLLQIHPKPPCEQFNVRKKANVPRIFPPINTIESLASG
jgi:hypothetical protein